LESVLGSGRIYGIRKNLVLFYTTPYQSWLLMQWCIFLLILSISAWNRPLEYLIKI